jgi:hypothetical protein
MRAFPNVALPTIALQVAVMCDCYQAVPPALSNFLHEMHAPVLSLCLAPLLFRDYTLLHAATLWLLVSLGTVAWCAFQDRRCQHCTLTWPHLTVHCSHQYLARDDLDNLDDIADMSCRQSGGAPDRRMQEKPNYTAPSTALLAHELEPRERELWQDDNSVFKYDRPWPSSGSPPSGSVVISCTLDYFMTTSEVC